MAIPPEFLSAVTDAHKSLLVGIERFRSFAKRDEQVILLNPFASTLGSAELTENPSDFNFWALEDKESRSVFFGDFAIRLDMLDLPASAYKVAPVGYGIARYVLRFETHRQFSSWLAMENVGEDDMVLVREYYRKAGLAGEADALEKVELAWYEAEEHLTAYKAARESYRSTVNPYADSDLRWEYLMNFLQSESLWVRS